jgi:hypothetical protein
MLEMKEKRHSASNRSGGKVTSSLDAKCGMRGDVAVVVLGSVE